MMTDKNSLNAKRNVTLTREQLFMLSSLITNFGAEECHTNYLGLNSFRHAMEEMATIRYTIDTANGMVDKKTMPKASKYLCPHCKKPLYPSLLDDYAFQCLDCDEDFYTIECSLKGD